MRITWKDSDSNIERKPIKYRGFIITGSGCEWNSGIPGDNNKYLSHYCAQNAIDHYFGDYGHRGTQKRISHGIHFRK